MTSSDLFKLRGKAAIVWGGGQGMGEHAALNLAAAGCDLAIVDISQARANAVAAQIDAMGQRSVALIADMTIEAEVERAVEAAESALGPLDIMVTVVGASHWKPLLEVTEDDWNLDMDLNLKSVLYGARAVARRIMAHGRSGSIVCINSVSGLTSAPFHAPYGAAKSGLTNLVRSMAVEWGPNIRINAIAPGPIITVRLPFNEDEDDDNSPFRRRLPLQRRGTTDEIGKAALFLTSDLASYVTGQTLAVDGGFTAAYLFDAQEVSKRTPNRLPD